VLTAPSAGAEEVAVIGSRRQHDRVVEPQVLLVVDDLNVPLRAAFADRLPNTLVEFGTRDDVVFRCTARRFDAVVLAAGTGDAPLAGLQALPLPPPVVVVFLDSADPRRAAVLRAGAWEFVAPPGAANFDALLALVSRIIDNDTNNARLDAQARQFRALVEASSDGVYILRDGQFSWANRRFQEMVGYSTDELTAPTFFMSEQIVAPSSRAFLNDRARRVDAGLVVEPRYEFRAQRKNGEAFDAQVSIAYIELEDGKAGALGIMQDITERKSFEDLLLQKNKELQLLNTLSSEVNAIESLETLLHAGCDHLTRIFGAAAAGISLLSPNRRTLGLKVSANLPDNVVTALNNLPIDSPTLLATAVRTGTNVVVDDLAGDPRIALAAVAQLGFKSALVVPLRRRSTEGDVVVGAAFCMLPAGRQLSSSDRDLMIAVGNVLGAAIERAALLDSEQNANRKLVALDDIALALSATLDADDVSLTVARAAHRLFGATRVMIASLAADGEFFVPQHVLDEGESTGPLVPIALDDTLMGVAVRERQPAQRVRPRDGVDVSINPVDGRAVQLLPYEAALFRQGVGTAVAIPIIIDGDVSGALWLGFATTTPLTDADLQVLSAVGTHVAIATKNAMLFSSRERALQELQAAQQKLVDSEKLNAIGLIAHGVAHDFNNVLGSILGRAQLLRSQVRDVAILKHADIIEKAARDGAETVRRIQELGRSERADDFVPVDVRAILDDVIELTRARTANKSVAIEADGSDDIRVPGNPSELREVLINLVHNAVDALPADGGSIRLTVRLHDIVDAEASDEPPRPVHICVSDNGQGIPDDVIGRIFDPYFTTKGSHGTGLGLSVSHSIVRRHGGLMHASSRTSGPSRGTTFTLELPRFVDDRVLVSAAAATATAGAPGRATVLVVDDEENIREILAEMLMTADHEVLTAVDGAEALHKLQNTPSVDLVLTDLGLPGMSGYEVAQEMKRLRPDLLVGLVTGWGATLDPEKARAHGVDLVISKPFRFEQVLGIVDEALIARAKR
jgi:PAS domain S-box-containing protein